MSKQFTLCSACGAVGEVGSNCQFCGTTIVAKEGSVISDARVVKQRTITPQQFAEKISIYHDVKPWPNGLALVSIGKMYGLINLNGDIVYPLGEHKISYIDENSIRLGTEYFCYGFFNIEHSLLADECGFVKDNSIPHKLYRVDIGNGWTPTTKYINFEGTELSYDYAEKLNDKLLIELDRTIYILYKEDCCALFIAYNSTSDEEYFDDIELSNDEIASRIQNAPESPLCIIEGIQNFYEIRKEKGKILLLLRTNDGIDVSITLGYENSEEDEDDVIYYDCAIDKIYNEWCKAIGKQIPETENEECEENEKCEQNEECKKNNNVAVWVAIIFFFAGGIFLFKSWLDFDDTKYLFPAIGSIGCAIWCIKKILF